MKIKFIVFFFLVLHGFAQKPKLHLIIAADVEDNAYTVRNFTKEEKILNMYNLVSRELGFDLETQYLHSTKFGFNGKGVLDELGKIKVFTKDDIIVFYYLGRGFYPNRNSKYPLLEFQDTKKMLSFEQIRGKLNTKKARLTLVIADCDESYTLVDPRTLPHSLIRSSYYKTVSDDFENSFFASIDNKIEGSFIENYSLEKSFIGFSTQNEDSLYLKKCTEEISVILDNNTDKSLDLNQLKRLAIISQIIGEYPGKGFPKANSIDKITLGKLVQSSELKYILERPIHKDYELFVDSLFLKRSILDFQDSLNLAFLKFLENDAKEIIPEYWEKEKEEKIDYYFEVNNILSSEIAKIDFGKPLNIRQKHDFAIFSRLENYKKGGLPNQGEYYLRIRKLKILNLPEITELNYKTLDFTVSDYDVIIDSLFLKRKLLDYQDSLSLLLDDYIAFSERPLIHPIEFLTDNEVEKYYENVDNLEQLIAVPAKNELDSVRKIRLKYFLNRLNEYVKDGFPKKELKLANIPSQRIRDINQITDFLYNSNNLFDFENSLQVKLDSIIDNSLSIHTIKLSKEQWQYYKQTLNSIDSLKLTSEVFNVILHRLKEFPELGFPDPKMLYFSDDQSFKQILKIEDVEYMTFSFDPNVEDEEKLRNSFYRIIIDSLYRSQSLLKENHPLFQFLKKLIERNLPQGFPIVKGISVSMSNNKPIIMQLFLSECGYIEIANGHKSKLNKNQYLEDYTGFVYQNFSEILNKYDLNQIGALSLKNLYKPLNNKFIYNYTKPKTNQCSVVSTTFQLPDFSKLPTTEKIDGMFDEYIKTNDQRKKRSLKQEIMSYFENKAMLRVKPVPSTSSTSTRLTNITLDDYFKKLDKNTPKVDTVDVRDGSVRRKQNFSKITTMMLIEK